MKRRLVALFLAALLTIGLIPVTSLKVFAASKVKISKTNFPDAAFRSYISEYYDKDGDGYLSTEERTIENMFVNSIGVSDFTGIKFFNVEKLYCSDNGLTNLDVSGNTSLKELNCSTNQLTSLDVSKNTKLETLNCYNNKLTSLDVSKNTLLVSLDFTENALTSIDVSLNKKLKYLSCTSNSLTSLDVSKNTALTGLDCEANKISSLDISKNTNLLTLNCSNNKLSSLDTTKNTKLERFFCGKNKLKSLNVSMNTKLEALDCSANSLTSLDVSKNTALMSLICGKNKLSVIDISNNLELTEYNCSETGVSSIDVSRHSKLISLYCADNNLKTIGVSKNTSLQHLACNGNQLTALNVRSNPNLCILSCHGNLIDKVDISQNERLIGAYDGDRIEEGDTIKYQHWASYWSVWPDSITIDQSTKLIGRKPRIETQPRNHEVSVGDEVWFEVEASGGGLAYQWYYRTSSSGSWTKVSAESGKSQWYRLTTKAKHNGYEYRCKVTNPQGSVYSDACTLTVLRKPKIVTQPSDVLVQAGETASFTMEVTGDNLTYQWYYSPNEYEPFQPVASASGKTANFQLTAKARHDGYRYYCVIGNGVAAEVYTKTCTLRVATAKPAITKQPEDSIVGVTEGTGFSVEATGGGLIYQWYYRTSADGEWKKVADASGKTYHYHLEEAKARHDGYQYRCKVTNAMGSVYSKIRTLRVVLHEPRITKQPEDLTVSAGETATFTVEATGEPLTYQWFYRASAADSWEKVAAASGKTASYSLTAKARHNGYQYMCIITNIYEDAWTKVVTLTVN